MKHRKQLCGNVKITDRAAGGHSMVDYKFLITGLLSVKFIYKWHNILFLQSISPINLVLAGALYQSRKGSFVQTDCSRK